VGRIDVGDSNAPGGLGEGGLCVKIRPAVKHGPSLCGGVTGPDNRYAPCLRRSLPREFALFSLFACDAIMS
jgi:hypothetical protein